MARRDADPGGDGGGGYATTGPDGSIPDVVVRWERAVHDPGVYDLEVDTSTSSAERLAPPPFCGGSAKGRRWRSRRWPRSRVGAPTEPPDRPELRRVTGHP